MLIEIKGLKAGYGRKIIVQGVNIAVDKGETIALIGHNGAGKTTTLKTVFGLTKHFGGEVIFKGAAVTGRPAIANVKDGICLLPQERYVFAGLSVKDNLDLGAYTSRGNVKSRLNLIFELFPILKDRLWQRAGTLSGGQQRMLGLGIALMTMPQLLLLDEPSLGLAPVLVHTLMDTLQKIQKELGISIILVEQNVQEALRIAQRAYVMKIGQIVLEENAQTLLQQGQWWDLF